MRYTPPIANEPAKKDAWPMRINKYLATTGRSTRRGADALIEAHKVYINERLAVLGDKVDEGDVVEVRVGKPKTYKYFAYNKPRGIITHSPQGEQEDIKMALAGMPEAADLFPVGRLDMESHGLIILTNDGRITDRLLNPVHEHEKEYRVETAEKLRDGFKDAMERGVDIGDYVTKPCTVSIESDTRFRIILGEGKKHQIRRMVDAMHNSVADLERIRVMNIELGGQKAGTLRAIEGAELAAFLKALNL